jgi:hypothetical protein
MHQDRPEAGMVPVAGPAPDIATAITEALGDRRRDARYIVDLGCSVYAGSQVVEGTLRDVSEGGAMLRGVAGLAVEDTLHIRLPHSPGRPFRVRVRGISLLGAHLAVDGAAELAAWSGAVRRLRQFRSLKGAAGAS